MAFGVVKSPYEVLSKQISRRGQPPERDTCPANLKHDD